MNNKKILYLSYDGMTDPLGQSQVIPYLKGLSKYGYSFTILSCEKPAIYKKNKELILDSIKGYPISWEHIPFYKRPIGLSTLINLRNFRSAAHRLQRKHQFDMVHTRSGPLASISLELKKKYNVKFLNDIRGFWSDEKAEGNSWNIKNPIYKAVYNYFKAKEFECLRTADYNTCLTAAAKKEMLSWKNNMPSPLMIEVIPCSVDLNLFDAEKIDSKERESLKKELGIKDDDTIITYLGSIGGWYLTDEMMEFCKIVSDAVPKLKFLFISPHRHEVILKTAEKYNIPKEKIIVKHGTRKEVPVLLSLGKYSLFFIKPCYSKLSSSPTKHGEIMSMGVPTITNSGIGDVDSIISKYNAGIIIEKLDSENYRTASNKIVQNIEFNSREIRAGASEFYSLDNAILKYLKVYQQIFGQS